MNQSKYSIDTWDSKNNISRTYKKSQRLFSERIDKNASLRPYSSPINKALNPKKLQQSIDFQTTTDVKNIIHGNNSTDNIIFLDIDDIESKEINPTLNEYLENYNQRYKTGINKENNFLIEKSFYTSLGSTELPIKHDVSYIPPEIIEEMCNKNKEKNHLMETTNSTMLVPNSKRSKKDSIKLRINSSANDSMSFSKDRFKNWNYNDNLSNDSQNIRIENDINLMKRCEKSVWNRKNIQKNSNVLFLINNFLKC